MDPHDGADAPRQRSHPLQLAPSGGWLDGSGAENGDKCAWISSGQGAAANVTLSTGTFPVQSLWSNAFNGGSGGCVLSY